MEGFLKDQLLDPTLGVSNSAGAGGAWERVFRTSSQVMLMLLVWGSNFENHFQRGFKGTVVKKNTLIFCHPCESSIFKGTFTPTSRISVSNSISNGSVLIWSPFTALLTPAFQKFSQPAAERLDLTWFITKAGVFWHPREVKSSQNQSDSLVSQNHLAKFSPLELAGTSNPLCYGQNDLCLWPRNWVAGWGGGKTNSDLRCGRGSLQKPPKFGWRATTAERSDIWSHSARNTGGVVRESASCVKWFCLVSKPTSFHVPK